MSKSLPYSMKDVDYDNAKFRHRSLFKMISQAPLTSNMRRESRDCIRCSMGKFLVLLMIGGLACLMLMHKSPVRAASNGLAKGIVNHGEGNIVKEGANKLRRLWRRPPRLPPRLPPDEKGSSNSSILDSDKVSATSAWLSRQGKVKEAFIHAWSGYRKYAMGNDELMPLKQKGVDGLGGLGATVVDALDTAMIMGIDEIVSEAGNWIEKHLTERINEKGSVNLFETTIRVLGGLLSAYHLSGGEQGRTADWGSSNSFKGPKPEIYLETAKNLADRLLSAFTSSPTSIPFSDVVLRDHSAHPAPDGLSSTSEVSTLQLEFNYLSAISGDPKYGSEAMKVLEHLKTLPKVEGLVPIFISPQSGEFTGENIRLGSRGDSYYEYLIKVWLQQGTSRDNHLKYLHEMYEEAMKGVRHLLVRKSIPKGLVFVGELPYGSHGSFSPKMDHLCTLLDEQRRSLTSILRTWISDTAHPSVNLTRHDSFEAVEHVTDPCIQHCVRDLGHLSGTLALGATKGVTKKAAMRDNLLTFEDLENLKLAEDLATTCFEMYSVTSTGLAPEIAYFHIQGDSEGGPDGGNKSSEYVNDIIIKPADRHNLLRPETVESLFVLHRITEDPKYREWGWQIFEAFEKYTKVDSGGYTSLDDVTVVPPRRRDKMETFFLGETLKYLYLLFGDNNILPLDKFVFNSEAHPFPVNGTSKV